MKKTIIIITAILLFENLNAHMVLTKGKSYNYV